MMLHLEYEDHIKTRACQRNLSPNEIEFIVNHASRVRRTGVIFCQMRRKDMPDDIPPNDPLYRLVGSTVILDKTERAVITAYRDPHAFKRDRRKSKYNRDFTH